MITIKKYGNRRLYDVSRSRYINLDELAEIIRAGEDIEIVDARTGEDLSREVLLQVFMEVLKGSEFFPTAMLRRVIRMSGDDPVSRALRPQLVAGLELMYQQLDRVEAALGRGAAPFMAGVGRGSTGPWSSFVSEPPGPAYGARQAPEPSAEPPVEHPPDAPPEDELAALRARLSALEQRLSKG